MKVKIFKFDVSKSDEHEVEINKWLEEEGLRLDDVKIIQNYDQYRASYMIITIWYTPKPK